MVSRQPRRPVRPHNAPPSRRTKLLRWITAILATAIAAVVVTAVTGVFNNVSQKVTEPSMPLQVVADIDRVSLSVVFPGLYTMPKEMQINIGAGANAQGVPKFEAFRRQWLTAGAYNYDEMGLGITIRMLNRGQRRVRVIGLDIVDLVRKPPIEGTLLHMPGQGGNDVFQIAFNLDEPRPIPHAVDEQGRALGSFFHRQELDLSKGDRDTIWVPVLVSRYSAHFRLRVSYLLGESNTPQHVTLDDEGKAFALSAPHCVKGLRTYQRIYSTQSPDLLSNQDRMSEVPDPMKYWEPALDSLDPCVHGFAAKLKQVAMFAG